MSTQAPNQPPNSLAAFHLAAIVQSSDDAVVSKNLDGIVQSWNEAAERIFGYRADEIVGRSIMLIIPPDRLQEEDDILARLRRGERIEHFDTMRRRKDGTEVEVSVTISPIMDLDGRIIGASKIARDISARKREEKEREALLLREQQARAEADAANRAKDEFLATLSHELRTPLHAIVGWAQLLGAQPDNRSIVRRAADTILSNARHQTQLIDDLLDLSRITSGRLRLDARPVELGGLITEALDTVRPAAEAKEISVETSLQPGVGPIWSDPERLQQVFWNLLSNAMKFTPRHGRVTIRLERAGSRAVISVSDTGIGIAPEVLPFIFDRFRQADSSISRAHGGLGLGLAIVRHLVDLHGGGVRASSPGEGQGATFTMTLPIMAIQPPERLAGSRTVDSALNLTGLHILLVEDDVDGRELVSLILKQAGASVMAVESGAAALDVLARERPHIIISDLAMPGMDGYKLIGEIRRLPGEVRIPVLALTAQVTAEARVKVFTAGFDGYVAKPVDPAELVGLILRHTGRH